MRVSFPFILAILWGTAESKPCQFQLEVEKALYTEGEDIRLSLENCNANDQDFVAIYDIATPLMDIKGDANYREWMWTCGNQRCRQAVDSNVVEFGTKNNVHTWPLRAGTYEAHLVKRLDSKTKTEFGSVARSSPFIVQPVTPSTSLVRQMEDMEEDCLDELTPFSTCYEEGNTITIALKAKCTTLTPEDWIGFYYDEPNKRADDKFYGYPLQWFPACNGNCDATSIKYKFKLTKSSVPLPGGRYRAIFVRSGYRDEGPYKAELVSDAFEVHPAGQSCQQTTEEVSD